MPPSSDEQIRFLVNLQRLLDEGSFVASYKFALLLALADLCIEKGDDSGTSMAVDTADIAEKFIHYYWRQVVPYPASSNAKILKQNIGKQAAIVKAVCEARTANGDSLPNLMRSGTTWRSLVTDVAQVVRNMPLRYLQNVGGERLDFLYSEVGPVINLRPGVTYCFRKFHALITVLVRGAWACYVRQRNLCVLGDTADLNEFLFGSERNNLAAVRPVLLEIQRGRCFYCQGGITGATAHVDHFVAWTRYPIDLGHNFVLADSRCNGYKGDRLAACDHLAAWTERNARYGAQLSDTLEQHGIIAELEASNRVAQWAYAQTEAVHGLTWVRADVMEPLAAGWRGLFG